MNVDGQYILTPFERALLNGATVSYTTINICYIPPNVSIRNISIFISFHMSTIKAQQNMTSVLLKKLKVTLDTRHF